MSWALFAAVRTVTRSDRNGGVAGPSMEAYVAFLRHQPSSPPLSPIHIQRNGRPRHGSSAKHMVTNIGTIATFDNVVLELGKLEERRELDSSLIH